MLDLAPAKGPNASVPLKIPHLPPARAQQSPHHTITYCGLAPICNAKRLEAEAEWFTHLYNLPKQCQTQETVSAQSLLLHGCPELFLSVPLDSPNSRTPLIF